MQSCMVGKFPNPNALIDDGEQVGDWNQYKISKHTFSIIFSILHSDAVVLDVNKAHKIITINDDDTSELKHKP